MVPMAFDSAGIKAFFEFHDQGRRVERKGRIIAEDPDVNAYPDRPPDSFSKEAGVRKGGIEGF